jgi:hypothetical protein
MIEDLKLRNLYPIKKGISPDALLLFSFYFKRLVDSSQKNSGNSKPITS